MVYTWLPPATPHSTTLQKPVSAPDVVTVSQPGGHHRLASTSQHHSHTKSKWRLGWRTPFWMWFFYMLSLFVAFLHLGLFLYLDQRRADGDGRAAPQSYVSTASNLLSGAFGISLKASLAVAFTQHLWYTLRRSALKVSTIESLFQVRSNLFLAFDRLVVTEGPILVFIAIFMCSIQVATSFPPGALTIGTTNRTWTDLTSVPTYNASFFGNGSGYDADGYSFIGFIPYGDTSIVPFTTDMSSSQDFDNIFIQSLATHTLVAGMPDDMPSPCGSNCSFDLILDIPYLQCNNSNYNITLSFNDSTPNDFDATWANDIFNATLCSLSETNLETVNPTNSYQVNNLICGPARANYILGVSYHNYVQKMNISRGLVTPLNVSSPAPTGPQDGPGVVEFPGFIHVPLSGNTSDAVFGREALDWTPPFISWYRDLQFLTLINCMAISLAGSIKGSNTGNNTIAPYTRMSSGYGIYSQLRYIVNASPFFKAKPRNKQPIRYHLTPELLNSALLNITLSAITACDWWHTNSTLITQWSSINVYDFSRPLNLVIPYFFSLFLALPILFIGAFALRANGVAAIDGGFTQLVTTTMGSAALEKAAAEGCLGGEENVPDQLKELEVRFGELVGEKGPVRRAGFGTREETGDLVRGRVYGTA